MKKIILVLFLMSSIFSVACLQGKAEEQLILKVVKTKYYSQHPDYFDNKFPARGVIIRDQKLINEFLNKLKDASEVGPVDMRMPNHIIIFDETGTIVAKVGILFSEYGAIMRCRTESVYKKVGDYELDFESMEKLADRIISDKE